MVKTYAFIHFESESDARKAVADLHKSKLLGKELTVEIAKNKPLPKRGNGQFPERRSRNTGLSNGPPPPNIGPVGGILGMGPGGPGNLPNALGLLNAVNSVKNAVAAASGQDQRNRDPSRERPPPSDGYVIYERFYVDRSHPLLKGLPVPELPRVQDLLGNRDTFKKDPFAEDVSIRDDHYANSSNAMKDDFGSGYSSRREDPNTIRDDYFSNQRRDDSSSYNNPENFRERSPLYNRREYDNRGRGGYDEYSERR